MKIIIVSHTPWDENNSFGNTFSNFFGGNEDVEIANIYCMGGTPNTNVCKRFFRISERQILKSITNRQPSGEEVYNCPDKRNNDGKVMKKAKLLRWQIFFWVRDLIWLTGKWRSSELDRFLDDFSPDLIFQPVYYLTYVNRVGNYVKERTGKPMVGFVSDDIYTMRQFSLSPLYWIDRLIKRRPIRKIIKKCSFLYTGNDVQNEEYQQIFGVPCKALYKGGVFECYKSYSLHSPLRLIYTGNIGSGRWKVLAKLALSLEQINKDVIKAQLYIYSATPVSKKMLESLNRPQTSFFMGAVTYNEVLEIQKNADILVHVEPFELSTRNSARLSFSTKVIDYLSMCHCILAIGWKESGAIAYLKEHDAAYIITDEEKILSMVEHLINNKDICEEYAKKGFECGKQNHTLEVIRKDLYDNLIAICNTERPLRHQKGALY